MQLYKGTGCEISIIGTLKSTPKFDDETQSHFIVLERRKPYFDYKRQFLQEGISWFRVTISNNDATRILYHANLDTLLSVQGDFNEELSPKPIDYTATMTEIIAKTVDFIPDSSSGHFNAAQFHQGNKIENRLLH